jgi:molybdate transport system substrate-binding protein
MQNSVRAGWRMIVAALVGAAVFAGALRADVSGYGGNGPRNGETETNREPSGGFLHLTSVPLFLCVLPFSPSPPLSEGSLIRVMMSGGFTAAFAELAPAFERATGSQIVTTYGGSAGSSPDTIPNRLGRGEPADVVIMAASALEGLIKQGVVAAGSRVDLARSTIGMAVRAGAAKPDISSVDALRRALLDAKSIAYSASASGVYLETELFPRLGIEDQVAAKSRKIEGEPVGAVVARGEAEIGFQQISELRPVKGIEIVGLLPGEAQRVTVFAAGITAASKQPDAARQLIVFLSSAAAAPAIRRSGMDPVTASKSNEIDGSHRRKHVQVRRQGLPGFPGSHFCLETN